MIEAGESVILDQFGPTPRAATIAAEVFREMINARYAVKRHVETARGTTPQ